jgi:hypothetical protein
MPKVQVNTDIALATLVDLANTLKKAIIVSAAAVLSRMTNDLKANAAAAVTHLDEMGRKLDGLRNDASQRNGVSFATKLKGKILEVDSDLFAERVGIKVWSFFVAALARLAGRYTMCLLYSQTRN